MIFKLVAIKNLIRRNKEKEKRKILENQNAQSDCKSTTTSISSAVFQPLKADQNTIMTISQNEKKEKYIQFPFIVLLNKNTKQ